MRQQVVIDKAVNQLQPRDVPILRKVGADDQGSHDEATRNERKAGAHAEQQQPKRRFHGGQHRGKRRQNAGRPGDGSRREA